MEVPLTAMTRLLVPVAPDLTKWWSVLRTNGSASSSVGRDPEAKHPSTLNALVSQPS